MSAVIGQGKSDKAFKLFNKAKEAIIEENYEDAFNSYMSGISICEKNHDYNCLFKGYVSLAEFYRKKSDYKSSEQWLYKAEILLINTQIEKKHIAYFYNRKAALISENYPNKDSVIYYSDLAIEIALEVSDTNIAANSYNEKAFYFI